MGKSVARKSKELKRFLGTVFGENYKLQHFAKKKMNISTQKSDEWLQTQDPYTLHKSVRKDFLVELPLSMVIESNYKPIS